MNIVVLSGSPRKNGNTHTLVQAFMQGAEQAGHQAQHFDVAAMNIGPCKACAYCRQEKTLGMCVQKDDMTQIYAALKQAQAIILATPLYYFGFSAQLKLAIDRFFSIVGMKRGPESEGGITKLGLLAVCGDVEKEKPMSGLVENYRLICNYLGIENVGEVLAHGVYDIGEMVGHPALQQGRELAQKL